MIESPLGAAESSGSIISGITRSSMFGNTNTRCEHHNRIKITKKLISYVTISTVRDECKEKRISHLKFNTQFLLNPRDDMRDCDITLADARLGVQYQFRVRAESEPANSKPYMKQ